MKTPCRAIASETGADTENSQGHYTLWKELSDGFDHNIKMLTYGTYLDIADSSQNPNNDLFVIPTYMAGLNLRPDFYLNFRSLDLSIKPRAGLIWSVWKEGSQKGEEECEDEWFINEWLARIGLTQELFASYGRENLQWGPSYLVSPSNPFFEDNGRSNPKEEIRGMDFARLVWTPFTKLTASVIANLDEGAQKIQFNEFEKIYALKLDYTGYEGYASMILSYEESNRPRLGVYGGWTASDALLLYGEGELSKGSDYFYPYKDGDNPLGATLLALEEDSSTIAGSLLLGGSYTFLAGPTLTMEYFYNGFGYDGDQARDYYGLRDKASDAFQGQLALLSKYTLAQTANTGLRFLRQNYAMLQYSHTDIYEVLNLIFRWTQNIDDGSGQFLYIIECYIGNHLQLFSIGNVNHGGQDTEYGSVLNSQWTIGLEYTF